MEDLPDKMKGRLRECQERCNLNHHDNGTHGTLNNIHFLNESYGLFGADEFSVDNIDLYQAELTNILAKEDVLQYLLDSVNGNPDAKKTLGTSIWSLLAKISDRSREATETIANQDGILSFLVNKLEIQRSETNDKEDIVSTIVILSNISRKVELIPDLMSLEITQVIRKYLRTPSTDVVSLRAIEILALIARKTLADPPEIDVDTALALKGILAKSHQNEWRLSRVYQVLDLLSSSTDNQKKILDTGCLSLLIEILSTGNDDEIGAALLWLRTLSSNPTNKDLLFNPALILIVICLYHHSLSESSVVEVCREILLNISSLGVAPEFSGDFEQGLNEVLSKSFMEQSQTKEEVFLKLSEMISRALLKAGQIFRGKDGDSLSPEFICCVKIVRDAYNMLEDENTPVDVNKRFREKLRVLMMRNGVLRIILDVVCEYCLSDGQRENIDCNSRKRQYWWTLHYSLCVFHEYSDLSSGVSTEIAKHEELLPLLIKRLQDYQEDTGSSIQTDIIRRALGVVHNVSVSKDLVPRLRELNVVQVILRYVQAVSIFECRLLSINTLPRVVDDAEAKHLITISTHFFDDIMQIITSALKRESHEHHGWHVGEMTDALKFLARCDANRVKLVEVGFLPVLATILTDGWPHEQRAAILCLQQLSYEPKNKAHIMRESGLITVVRELYRKMVNECKNACSEILQAVDHVHDTSGATSSKMESDKLNRKSGTAFGIVKTRGKGKTSRAEQCRKGIKRLQESSANAEPNCKGGVLLSYDSDDEEKVNQIRLGLKKRKISVLTEACHGCPLEAKAKAVENASAVLLAMSQRYKDSSDCKRVADYARKLEKPIIPLVIEPGYEPKGWLGLILGSVVTYDFTEANDSKIERLVKTIKKYLHDEKDNNVMDTQDSRSYGDSPCAELVRTPSSSGALTTSDPDQDLKLVEEELAEHAIAQRRHSVEEIRNKPGNFYVIKNYVDHVDHMTTTGSFLTKSSEEETINVQVTQQRDNTSSQQQHQ